MIGIYKITNPKGKIYIGQSVNIEDRKSQYKHLSKYSLGRKIFNSIKKYGWDKHQHEIIEECSLDLLDDREIYWGGYYEVLTKGLNLALGQGRGKCSDETKLLMSESAKKSMTPERRLQLSKAKQGVSRSEEAKEALRVPKKSKENYKDVGKWIKNQTPVFQYNINGDFIKKWNFICEAECYYHITVGNNISNCCGGRQKTAYGYKWSYNLK